MSDNTSETVVLTFQHLLRTWRIVKIGHSYYARDDHDQDCGPFGLQYQAEEWVKSIRP